jgi:hypothetical protein
MACLDRLDRIDVRLMADTMGRGVPEFLRRRWISVEAHLTRVMVPVLDSLQEVEVEIDLQAGVYRYPSAQVRGRVLQRPLAEIALHALQVDAWLDELTTLIGIEARRIARRRQLVRDHLWHLGDVRVGNTHDFAPVFVSRAWSRAPQDEVRAALADPIWPRGGVLLGHGMLPASVSGEHASRALDDFVRVEDGMEVFDAGAFDRVLRGHVTGIKEAEPDQFIQANRLKLPHFPRSRELSEERAKIVKLMWGMNGQPAPVLSWAEVNTHATTGYQSFDDAFGGKPGREDVIECIQRGKYRLRRNP